MKRRKGFTLIELLAVIVILAIIAVIAIPIIVSIIEDARNKSNEVGVTNYIDVLEQQVAMKNITEQFNPSECELKGDTLICDNEEVEMSVSGDKPTSGYATLEDGKVTRYNFQINGTTVTNETPLECFNLEQTETGYKITGYSDSCTKDVIIPKYNTNDESAYLDMYEIVDVSINIDKCIENYMNDTADATEDSANSYCLSQSESFNKMKEEDPITFGYSVMIMNYSLENRNAYLPNLESMYNIIYSDSKVMKKSIKGYKFNMNKCQETIKELKGISEAEAKSFCATEIEPSMSSIPIEIIEDLHNIYTMDSSFLH